MKKKTINVYNRENLIRYIEAEMSVHGTEVDLNHLDVSGITDFSGVFSSNRARFNGDISKWNTENAIDMYRMFYESDFNGDISKWNIKNLKRSTGMFESSAFDQDLPNWDTGQLKEAHYMFFCSCFSKDVSSWNLSRLEMGMFMFAHSRVKTIPVPALANVKNYRFRDYATGSPACREIFGSSEDEWGEKLGVYLQSLEMKKKLGQNFSPLSCDAKKRSRL